MTLTVDERHRMEAYLTRVKNGLRGIMDDEVREIVEELRSHIVGDTIGVLFLFMGWDS